MDACPQRSLMGLKANSQFTFMSKLFNSFHLVSVVLVNKEQKWIALSKDYEKVLHLIVSTALFGVVLFFWELNIARVENQKYHKQGKSQLITYDMWHVKYCWYKRIEYLHISICT